jgi:uncharacterized protein (TIGR02453 family)
MTTAFSGFPREAFDFFRDLASHNNRDWFQAHKDVYERACRDPLKALVRALDPLGAARISRINRDMRFSREGGPYKTHIAAGIDGYYVSLSSEGVYVATGIYKPEPPTLARLRAAIDNPTSGRSLGTIVASMRRKGYEIGTHDSVRSAPKGYSSNHPRIELLRMKDIFAGRLMKPEPWLATPKALDRIKRTMSDVRPLRDWIRRHVR